MSSVDPLRAICAKDEAAYRDSLAKIGARLERNSAIEIWRSPLGRVGKVGFTKTLIRWIEIDVLELQAALTREQIAILRAETLAAFAISERSTEAARWAVRWLEGIEDERAGRTRDKMRDGVVGFD
jgi:hypothetical protein